MFKGITIKRLLEERNITKKSLIEYLETSPSVLDKIINNGNPTASNIERIADFFNVSIDVFFDRSIGGGETPSIQIGHTVSGSGNTLNGDIALSECKAKLDHIQELLKEKDLQIELMRSQLLDKERLIQVLMTK